jgi:acid phosphatase type 7
MDRPAAGAAGHRRFSEYAPAEPIAEITKIHERRANQPFRPLPKPTGPAPYHLSLEAVLPPSTIAAIQEAGRLVFHVAGDTGGIKTPQDQKIVAMHMVYDCETPELAARPAFFYVLGDVVYYNGEAGHYYDQFYEPYLHYPSPVFAIPGNHDGDIAPNSSVPSLAAFVENFCAEAPHLTPEAQDVPRDAMTQPNVYWTLEAPFVTIIGLYTNVPEGGEMDDDQIAWLESELRTAPRDKALLLASHHPVYSLDDFHSGSAYMAGVLDQAFARSHRTPDAVLTGHVHDYQRFTRHVRRRQVPYIVAGAGGYWNLHYLSKALGLPVQTPLRVPGSDATLESYRDNRHGYLTLEVAATTIRGRYTPVPRLHEHWTQRLDPIDTFTLDLRAHRLVP